MKAMTRDNKKFGPVYEVWWFPKPGEIRKTSVSIYKYGQKEALRRAIALRRAGEKLMYGKPLSQIPRKPKKQVRPRISRKRK